MFVAMIAPMACASPASGANDTAAPSTSDNGATTTSRGGSGNGNGGAASNKTSTADGGTADSGATVTTTTTTTTNDKIYGVTIDDVSGLASIVTSLQNLAHKPTARVVFDEKVAATYYQTPVDQISSVAYVMGELLDSQYVETYTTQQYLTRTDEYLSLLGGKVDIWEVGNEINGEWLGDTATVVAKMSGAYDKVKAAGKKTALTLYYNQDCWTNADHEMFTWTQANVPASMKSGLDYVLVSYYEDDCNGLQPDWNAVFAKLAQAFPSSKLGIGECGTTHAASKATYIDRYYKMSVTEPRFVGGYFWWYFREDMVPSTNALWTTLNDAIK